MGEARKVVLVVDDEAGMRDMLHWTLEESAFHIVLARDGEEAAALLAAFSTWRRLVRPTLSALSSRLGRPVSSRRSERRSIRVRFALCVVEKR